MTRKLWISFGIPSFEHLKLLEESIVGAKESTAAPKEIKCNESDTKSSSDEETDDLEDEDAVQGRRKQCFYRKECKSK